MKKALIIIPLLLVYSTLNAQVQWDLGLDYVFESEETGYFNPPDRFSGMGSAVMLRGSALFEWGEYFIGGPYIGLVPGIEIFRFDESTSWVSVGLAVGPRFTIADDHEIRGLAQIGYRQWLTGSDFLSSNGLATNLNIAFIFNKDHSISPKAEIGFLAQAAGGNEDVEITFSPIWYIGGGVVIK